MESATSGEANLLLTCEDEEFDIIIHELSAGEILNTITELHQETSHVQQNVRILQDQIKSIPAEEKQDGENSSERYKTLVAELKNSQALLAKLINKSMKCFSQHKQKKLLEKGQASQLNSNLKTEVHINTISKTDQSLNSGTTNHSNNHPEPDSGSVKTSKPIAENREPAKGIVAPSNGISHNELGKKTSPVAVKSARTSVEGSGKTGGRKLIQEYSSKTPMDAIRAEIYKNVDKTAKENVSKLLVNNVAHLYNKDVKLRSKDDILAFKAEIEAQVAAENNLSPKKGKVSVSQNAHEEAKNTVKVTVNKEEARADVARADVARADVARAEVERAEVASAEEARADDLKIEVNQNNKTLSPTVTNNNAGNENYKSRAGISVTEVTISSSSTDRSPEPRQKKESDAVYSRQLSGARVEHEERISNKNMLESASMLERFFQGRNGGAVPGDPPVKNFTIKSKGSNGLGNKRDIPVHKIEEISESSASHDEKNGVESDFQINEESKSSDSMTKEKDEDEGKRFILIFSLFRLIYLLYILPYKVTLR